MKRYPFIKQQGLKDCGPACIQMILKYYGGYMNMEKLNILLNTSNRGTSVYNMVKCLNNLGFKSEAFKFKELTNIKTPCIVHIKKDTYSHYIVIYKINTKDQNIIIADPNQNIKKITFIDFFSFWTGITILMKPKTVIVKEKEPKISTFIKNIFKQNIKNIIFIGILSIVICFLSIASTSFIQKIINNSHKNLVKIFIFLLIFKTLLVFLKNIILIKINHKIDKNLLTNTFTKIIYLPYLFSKNKTSGELISYFNDLYMVKNLLEYIQILLINIPLIIMTVVLLVTIDIKIFLMYLTIMIMYFIIYITFHKKNYYLSDEVLRNKALLNSYITETITAYKTINNLNIHDKIINNFKNKYKKYSKINKEYETLKNKEFLLNNLITNISIFLLILYSFINKNNIIIIYLLTTLLATSFREILEYQRNLPNIIFSIKHILEIIEIHKQKTNSSNSILIKQLTKTFDEKTVLKNINLKIKKGEKIFVTGKSGSGKSTLFKIIKGYYNYKGLCLVDGKKSNEYNNLNIIYVSQNEKLFTGTILDNLKIIKYKPINKMICEIEKLKNEEIIYENGFNISEGQKQRIALARSLSKFDTIIIDEALNAVDTNMERRILKRLLEEYKKKTIIFISHRLDNLDLFDRLIKIENGKIILDEKRNIKKGSIYEIRNKRSHEYLWW